MLTPAIGVYTVQVFSIALIHLLIMQFLELGICRMESLEFQQILCISLKILGEMVGELEVLCTWEVETTAEFAKMMEFGSNFDCISYDYS